MSREVARQQNCWTGLRRCLQSMESTEDGRIKAAKVIARQQFPGVQFNDVEECYQALTKERGRMARCATRQVEAENPDAIKDQNILEARNLLSGHHRALHKALKSYFVGVLLNKSGILKMLDPNTTYTNNDPRAIAIHKFCVKYSKDILFLLRL